MEPRPYSAVTQITWVV